MFFRSIIFLSAVFFIVSCLTSCDANGKSASQLRQEELIAKLNQEKKDRETKDAASADYTFEQKEGFLKEMNSELAGLQTKIDALSQTTEKEVQDSVKGLKEEMDMAKKHIEETQNSDASMWEETKRAFRNAARDLKASIEKVEKMTAEKTNK